MAVREVTLLFFFTFSKNTKKTQNTPIHLSAHRTNNWILASVTSVQIFLTHKNVYVDKLWLFGETDLPSLVWSNESTFLKRGNIEYLYCGALFNNDTKRLREAYYESNETSQTSNLKYWHGTFTITIWIEWQSLFNTNCWSTHKEDTGFATKKRKPPKNINTLYFSKIIFQNLDEKT